MHKLGIVKAFTNIHIMFQLVLFDKYDLVVYVILWFTSLDYRIQ